MSVHLYLLVCLSAVSAQTCDVNIVDFGAVPDGKTLATKSIQKAIDHCATNGGGTVTVPSGTFLTNTIYLKSHVHLRLQSGAVILGNTDPQAFDTALIYAKEIENASITGPGTVNGQGFKENFPTRGRRHNNIRLFKSRNITVRDLTLINSPSWVFRILQCENVMVDGVRIRSFANENNDGIDIDGKDITISNCIIDCDDDAICLKSDDPNYLVENIAIINCVVASNCNGIKFGTASHCGFRNVSISNCVIRRPSESPHRRWSAIHGVTSDDTVISGLALEVVDGGMMDQVVISNIAMTGVQTPLFIRLGSRRGTGSLKNVVISNITATNESLITSSITGIPGSYVENVTIKDVILNYKGGGTMAEAMAKVPEQEKAYPENRMFGYSLPAYGLYVRHVKNLLLDNFRFNLRNPDSRPAIVLDDCHGIKLSNFSADPPSDGQPLLRLIESTNVLIAGYRSTDMIPLFLRAEGESCADIKLIGNDLSNAEKVAELGEECRNDIIEQSGNLTR